MDILSSNYSSSTDHHTSTLTSTILFEEKCGKQNENEQLRHPEIRMFVRTSSFAVFCCKTVSQQRQPMLFLKKFMDYRKMWKILSHRSVYTILSHGKSPGYWRVVIWYHSVYAHFFCVLQHCTVQWHIVWKTSLSVRIRVKTCWYFIRDTLFHIAVTLKNSCIGVPALN